MGRPNYWFGPGNTLDRATSMIPTPDVPALQDFGIDFAVVYPTLGLGGFQGPTACRAPVWHRPAALLRPRVQHHGRRDVPRLRRPPDAGGDYPDRHAAGRYRGSRVRRQDAGTESRHAARRHSATDSRRRRLAARPAAAAPLLRQPRARQSHTTTTRCGPSWSSLAWRTPATAAAAAIPPRAPRPRAWCRAASATSPRRTRWP